MTYVTSDWHGVPLATIQSLLAQAAFGPADTLYILGDVIDRGEHGVALLRWILTQPNIIFLLGNHESMMLDCAFLFEEAPGRRPGYVPPAHMRDLLTWQRNGSEPTVTAMNRLPAEERCAILDYLRAAPLYAQITVAGKDYLLVHGGLGHCDPARFPAGAMAYELLWTRPAPTTRYSRDYTTIIGHTPTHYYGSDCKGRIYRTPTWWDIDTGASGGGTPMLLCLDDDREIYADT